MYALTSPNRSVYASPPVGGSGYEKTQSGLRPLCVFSPPHFFAPVKMLRIFPHRAQKNVIYSRNVRRHSGKNDLKHIDKKCKYVKLLTNEALMNKKILCLIFVLVFLAINSYSQENTKQNWFQKHFNNKIYLGYYSSYFDDNIQLLQCGYEALLRLIDITPNYNLLDVGIGLNGLLAYDMVNEVQKDNFGHERPKNGRMTIGFELNWNVRMYILPH